MVPTSITVQRVVDPIVRRVETEYVLPGGSSTTVLDLVRGGWRPFQDFVIHNGQMIPADRWAKRYVFPGDEVIFPGTPKGIGVAIGTAVATFLLPTGAGLVLATGTVVFLPSIGFVLLSGFVALVVNLGIAIAASVLISKLIGTPGAPRSAPGDTFLFSGVSTTAFNGQPIPIIYGEQVAAGNIIGSSVREGPVDTAPYQFLFHRLGNNRRSILGSAQVGSTPGDQLVNLTLGFCEGPVENIAGLGNLSGISSADLPDETIRINGLEANFIPSAVFSLRRGTLDQRPIPGQRFDTAVTDVNIRGRTIPGYSVAFSGGLRIPERPVSTILTIGANVPAIDLIFFFANGWFIQNDRRTGQSARQFFSAFRYKKTGESLWTYPNSDITNPKVPGSGHRSPSIRFRPGVLNRSPFILTERIVFDDDVFGFEKQVQVLWWTVGDDDALNPQPFTLQEYRELTEDGGLAFPYIAHLGLRYTPNSELRSVNNVTVRIKGKKVYVWDGVDSDPELAVFAYQYSSNPAWCLLDFILNQRYGGGEKFTLRDIDLPSFLVWANYCDELIDDGEGGQIARWALDYTIEGGVPFWDVVTQICAVGRAQAIKVGNKISITIDREAAPVQLFTSANIIQDTFKIQYTGNSNRPTRVEVQFKNRFKDFQVDVVSHSDEAILRDDLSNFRSETVSMPGISHPERALRMARYMVNASKFITRGVEFETRVDGMVAMPGAVIAVQHELPRWDSIGAVVLSSTSNTVKLDRPFTQEVDTRYRMTVRTTATGQNVLQQRELPIVSTETVWNRNQAITVNASWDVGDEPLASDVYSIHKLTDERSEVRLYKVIAVEPGQGLTARLACLEYDVRIYDDEAVVNESGFLAVKGEPDVAPWVGALRLTQVVGGGNRGVLVSWLPSAGASEVVVYRRERDLGYLLDPTATVPGVGALPMQAFGTPNWSKVGAVRNVGSLFVDGLDATGYDFAVAPVGVEAPRGRKGSITIDYQSRAPRSIVTDLVATHTGDTAEVTWTDPEDPLVSHYEIRRGEQWQTSRQLGTAQGSRFVTKDFAVGADKFFVRGISHDGTPSGRAASLAFSFGHPPESPSTFNSDFALDWELGTLVGLETPGPGDVLIFSAGILSGTWTSQVLEDVATPEPWRTAIRLVARGLDTRSFWKFDKTVFSAYGTVPIRQFPPVSRWRPRWRKEYVKRNAHGTLVPQFRYTVEWRYDETTNPPTMAFVPFVQGTYLYRYSQYRITMERDSTTDIEGFIDAFEVSRSEVV